MSQHNKNVRIKFEKDHSKLKSTSSSLSCSSKSYNVNVAMSITSSPWLIVARFNGQLCGPVFSRWFLSTYQASIAKSRLKHSNDRPSSLIRSKLFSQSLPRLLLQSFLIVFIRENILSNFAFVNGQIRHNSNMSRTFLHSFTISLFVNIFLPNLAIFHIFIICDVTF